MKEEKLLNEGNVLRRRGRILKQVALVLVLLLLVTSTGVTQQVFAMAQWEGAVAEVVLLPYDFAPQGYYLCDGRTLSINGNEALFSLIGIRYGGNGSSTFQLPNLSKLNQTQDSTSLASPLADLRYYISTEGIFGNSERSIGEIFLLPSNLPDDYTRNAVICQGQTLSIAHYSTLFSLLGTQYGGNGTNEFKIPDMRDMSPVEGYSYYIALNGLYPSYEVGVEPLLGAIGLYAGTRIPEVSKVAAGQSMPIAQNTALFSLLGTKFGGDGRTTYALPDLRMASPLPGMNYYIAPTGYYPSRP